MTDIHRICGQFELGRPQGDLELYGDASCRTQSIGCAYVSSHGSWGMAISSWSDSPWTHGSMVGAELWAIHEGIKHCFGRANNLQVFSDNDAAVQIAESLLSSEGWPKYSSKAVINFAELLEFERDFAAWGQRVTVAEIRKKAGHPLHTAADALSKLAARAGEGIRTLQSIEHEAKAVVRRAFASR